MMAPPVEHADPVTPSTRRRMLHEMIYHQEAINKFSWAYPPLEPGTNAGSYAEMLRDPAVAYGLGVLVDAVVAGGWQIEPARGERTGRAEVALAEELRANLNDLDVEAHMEEAMNALWRGFAVHEITWRYRRGRFVLDDLAAINPDQIAFELDDQMRVLRVISRPFGMGLRETKLGRDKVWIHFHRASRIKPIGESVLEPVYRAWSSKNRLLQFWGLSIQRFGMQALKVTIPANTPTARQTAILNTLYQGRLDGIYLIPEDCLVEAMNPTAWANLTFEKAIDYQDAEIVRGLLYFWQASQATGATHITGTALTELNRATAHRLKRLSQALGRSFTIDVIQPLCMANWGAHPRQCPQLVMGQPDATAIAQLAAPLSQLVAAGIADAETAAGQLGLPEPTIVKEPQNGPNADTPQAAPHRPGRHPGGGGAPA